MPKIPIDINTGKLKDETVIVGIDLGTTNSLVAKMDEGEPVALSDYGKDAIVPSVVHFGPGGGLVVGEEARDKIAEDPANTIYSVKRLMGKSYGDLSAHAGFFGYKIIDDDTDRLVKVQAGGRVYTPVELSAFILTELKKRAEHRLKNNVEKAVITVPAYFNDAQRQATRDAGKLAGLEVLRIVNEPTAAALAYGLGLNPEEQKTVAVYDLGGGTFDVTLLRIEGGVFEVLATNGDVYLGGDDFDRTVMEHWLAEHNLDADAVLADKAAGQALRLAAEAAKKALSSADEWRGTLETAATGKLELTLSRGQFEGLIQPLVARTIRACRAALKDAKLKTGEIDEVVLVGGSTRTPLVRQNVEAFFGKAPHVKLDPDQVVALGAAIQADILAGNRKDLLLLDVTPLSLGLETMGGLMDVLITRNSKIPARVSRSYTTSVDGQVNMRVAVYQGERELVADNRKLAEFELKGIPAMPAGLPKIEITFWLDADGALKVTARELRSGVEQEISVKPSYGLTDEEVEAMLLDSFTHGQSDMERRLLLEARAEAEQTLYHAEKFIGKHLGTLMTEADAEAMREKMNATRALLETDDRQALRNAVEELEAVAKPFAHQAMDAAVQDAMSGKEV